MLFFNIKPRSYNLAIIDEVTAFDALWSRIVKNPDVSTGPLTLTLAPLTCLPAVPCLLRSRALLHWLLCSLAHSLPRYMGKCMIRWLFFCVFFCVFVSNRIKFRSWLWFNPPCCRCLRCRCRVRQISKWDNFWMLWDINLIFRMHLYYVNPLFNEKFYINWIMRTSPTSLPAQILKICPIWLKFGMQVSFTPLYHPEKFRCGRSVILPSSPTNPNADL